MEVDPKPSCPDFQDLDPPQISPYPSQQPPPTYAQAITAPAYGQPYYPSQFTPVPQAMPYQPTQYVVTAGTAPPLVGAALQPKYSDYMCWSVFSLLFCCLPLGLAALIISRKTQDDLARQDLFSARSHSATARGLNILAMILGVFCYISITTYMVTRLQLQQYYG